MDMIDIAYVVMLQFLVILVIFVAQAMYTKSLLATFRKQIYKDVADYLVAQTGKGKKGILRDLESPAIRQSVLRLIRKEDKH
jgi:hypothetical protein